MTPHQPPLEKMAGSAICGDACQLTACLQSLPLTWLIDLSQCFLDHSKAVAPPLVRNGILPQWMANPLFFDRTPAVQQGQSQIRGMIWECDPV